MPYPPYEITSGIIHQVESIGELLGSSPIRILEASQPRLRRFNQIRNIQASLEIEGNTLTLEQVTAVIEGKRVLGDPAEIQEVRNALLAYESMKNWRPSKKADLLKAHRLLMTGLVDKPGSFRQGSVGIQRGEEIVHVAPPAERVPSLVTDLMKWLREKEEHPLISSCVFHYELEFIHPFSDGNGRLGRLWQTLILSKWKQLFSMLPLETVVRDRQKDYYKALGQADKAGAATGFVEFMLDAIRQALGEALGSSDQVGDQVSDQVAALLKCIGKGEKTAAQLMESLGLTHRPTFRKNYLNPALEQGFIERTDPASPRSPKQKYRIKS